MHVSIEALLDRQMRRWEQENRPRGHDYPGASDEPPRAQPVVTVSRQHGARGSEVAEHLAARFGYTLLHRNAINRICESTGYTRRLLEVLDERARSRVTLWVESVLAGRSMDEHDYAHALLQTIRSIAALGGVVVVGRAANFIVGPEKGLHVRVVAPREERVAEIARVRRLGAAEAAKEVESVDHERRQFVRRLFSRDVDDATAYDLVVNSSGRAPDAIAALVEHAAAEKFARLSVRPAVALREH